MTGQGGWPMTVFLHARRPPVLRRDLLPAGAPRRDARLRRAAASRRRRLADRARRPARAGRPAHRARSSRSAELDAGRATCPAPSALDAAARTQLARRVRPAVGRVRRGAQVPPADSLELLLRAHAARRRRGARQVVTTPSTPWPRAASTTTSAAASPATRSTSGGWCRTSRRCSTTRPCWPAPTCTPGRSPARPGYRQVLDETVGYVLRDLRHPSGGFFSAEDADCEGEEGAFYVWTPDELRDVLGDDADAGHRLVGRHRGRQLRGRATSSTGPSGATCCARRGSSGPGRRCSRPASERVRPGLDDKVLTEWNGLMLATLAEAAAATGEAAWLDAAVADRRVPPARAAPSRRPLAALVAGRRTAPAPGHLACAADHAALVDAFTRLAEATGEARWIAEARDGGRRPARPLLGRRARAGCSPPATTARRSSPARRTCSTTPRRRPTPWPPSPCSGSPPSPASCATRNHADQILQLLGPLAAQHPGLRPPPGGRRPPPRRHHRGRGRRRPARPRGRPCMHRYLPNAVLAWGEPYDSPALGGPPAGLRLRLSRLRLPGAGRRRRGPRRAAVGHLSR